MPSREPTYYRWAEDKPCTTNQTYGFELRNGDGRNPSSTCPICIAEAAAEAAKAAKIQAQRQQRQAASAAARSRRDGSSTASYSDKVQTKPINKGYTMGHVPITQRLQAASGRQRRGGASGTGASACDQHRQLNDKDLYLWHALSGTLVYCKNDEEFDE